MQSVPKVDHKVFQNWIKGDQSRSKGIKGGSRWTMADQRGSRVITVIWMWGGVVGLYYDDLP